MRSYLEPWTRASKSAMLTVTTAHRSQMSQAIPPGSGTVADLPNQDRDITDVFRDQTALLAPRGRQDHGVIQTDEVSLAARATASWLRWHNEVGQQGRVHLIQQQPHDHDARPPPRSRSCSARQTASASRDELCNVYPDAHGAVPGEDTREKSQAFRAGRPATGARSYSLVTAEVAGQLVGFAFGYHLRPEQDW